jgi:hypothetical protein
VNKHGDFELEAPQVLIISANTPFIMDKVDLAQKKVTVHADDEICGLTLIPDESGYYTLDTYDENLTVTCGSIYKVKGRAKFKSYIVKKENTRKVKGLRVNKK